MIGLSCICYTDKSISTLESPNVPKNRPKILFRQLTTLPRGILAASRDAPLKHVDQWQILHFQNYLSAKQFSRCYGHLAQMQSTLLQRHATSGTQVI